MKIHAPFQNPKNPKGAGLHISLISLLIPYFFIKLGGGNSMYIHLFILNFFFLIIAKKAGMDKNRIDRQGLETTAHINVCS